jgi:P27 family predicted phage terminase small subunit
MSEYSAIGLITKVDSGSFLMLCNEFGTYCEADDLIKAQGLEIETAIRNKDGEIVDYKKEANPNLKTRNDAFKNYKALCVEFGLTPSSRAALNTPQKKESDNFAEF